MIEWGQGPSSPPPRSPFAHRPTSSSCASAPWESVLRKPDYQTQAVEQFRQASQLNAKSAPDRLNYALALLRAGNAKEGVGELEAVQKMDPKLPHTWFNLGIEYKKMGETDKAIAQLEQMARLVADEPITQYNLGVLYKAAGRAPDANAKFALSARLDPNFAAPHFQLFNFYRQQGQADRAKEELGRFQDLKSATKRPAPATKTSNGASIPKSTITSIPARRRYAPRHRAQVSGVDAAREVRARQHHAAYHRSGRLRLDGSTRCLHKHNSRFSQGPHARSATGLRWVDGDTGRCPRRL